MKRLLLKQNGSAMVLALLFVMFTTLLAAGALPFINSNVRFSAMNADVVEAQYAAEAGAKRAIIGIANSRTDWAWTLNNTINAVADGTIATKKYVTTISPAMTNGAAPSGTSYTVTSTGTVNNVSKTVVVTLTMGSSPFQYAIYSNGTMTLTSGTVTGNIVSTGQINVLNGMVVTGAALYTGNAPNLNQTGRVTDGSTKVSSLPALNVASLMVAAPAMPAFSQPTTALPKKSQALTGAYDYNTNPTSGAYYYNTNFSNWSYNYTVAANQSVFIYVNGNFTIGSPITGGGNITIYATGDITVSGNITGNNVKIYAGKTITLSQNTITGNNIILQSAGNFSDSGGSASAGSSGTINIYSGGTFYTGSGSITAGTVNIMVKNSANNSTPVRLSGGSINSGQPDYMAKIYSAGPGLIDLASGTLGGLSMIVATGNINQHGTSSSAILITSGNITAVSGSNVGLYANGTVSYSGNNSYNTYNFAK